MNPALISSGFFGILGLCRFYEGLMNKYVLFSKNIFPGFVMVNLRIPAEGLHFLVEFLKMENRILVLHYWVVFLKKMIAMEIILHLVYQKQRYLQRVFACTTI